MNPLIKGIGFDLFNTLIIADPSLIKLAFRRMTESLINSGIKLNINQFKQNYKEAAIKFLQEADETGIETHNSLWISLALKKMGISLLPDHSAIKNGVDSYFSVFFDHCYPIPGTMDMLKRIGSQYRIGLLSNFTHGPAERKLIELLGIDQYFDSIIIFGEVGYRKPNPRIFHIFCESMNLEPGQMIYIGDDPLYDIEGALRAGLQPLWMTYVIDNGLSLSPGFPTTNSKVVAYNVPKISRWEELYRFIE